MKPAGQAAMLKAYLGISGTIFRAQLGFRSRAIIAMINNFVLILVNVSVWNALYGGRGAMAGVEFPAMVANLVLGIGLSLAFSMDETFTSRRIRSGEISSDLLLPLRYGSMVFFRELGQTLYRLLIEYTPALVLSLIFLPIQGPASALHLLGFIASLAFSYVLLFQISMVTAYISFWYFNIWSFSTFKNALILVFSGAYLPFWFLPDWLQSIVIFTPFPSLISAPMTIYLGLFTTPEELAIMFGRQAAWVLLFILINRGLWHLGYKKLTIQGA